jgi:hypothetical protein
MAPLDVLGVPPDALAAMQAELATGSPGSAQAAPDPAQDLEILFPEREIAIDGERIVLREYTFMEGLRIGREHAALLADLRDLFLGAGGEASPEIEIDALTGVLAAHAGSLVALMALASGREPAWIESLSDAHGQDLLMAWWGVERDFFGRRLAAAAVGRALHRMRAERSVSGQSSPS